MSLVITLLNKTAWPYNILAFVFSSSFRLNIHSCTFVYRMQTTPYTGEHSELQFRETRWNFLRKWNGGRVLDFSPNVRECCAVIVQMQMRCFWVMGFVIPFFLMDYSHVCLD